MNIRRVIFIGICFGIMLVPGFCGAQGVQGLLWEMEDIEGAVTLDASGNYPINLLGDPILDEGVIGRALQFDGSDDYADVDSVNSYLSGEQGAISVWVKRSFENNTNVNGYVFRFRMNGSNEIFARYRRNNDTWMFRYRSGRRSRTVSMPADTLPKDMWSLLSFTWDRSQDEFKVFVDQAQVGSTQNKLRAWSGNFATSRIGSDHRGRNRFVGSVDNLRVYDSPLALEDILTIYSDDMRRGSTMLRADVDESGMISIIDAALTQRNVLGLSMAGLPWVEAPQTGDSDCSQSVTIVDAALIQRRALGLNMSATPYCDG